MDGVLRLLTAVLNFLECLLQGWIMEVNCESIDFHGPCPNRKIIKTYAATA